MKKCERCGAIIGKGGYDLMDYCAECSTTLCEPCMEKGCCDNTPARSGMGADDDSEEPEPDYDAHRIGESVSERQALKDAGRGHLTD